MHARQELSEVAVAFIGDDDRRAGLRDQEIGAGDADIGSKELFAQDAACLRDQLDRLLQRAILRQVLVYPAEIGLDLIAVEMHGGRDDVAGRFLADLDDVFAEIGLGHLEPRAFEGVVQRDFLGDHRLALGHQLCPGLAAEIDDDPAGILGGRGPMHVAARVDDLLLVGFEIEVEVGERVVLDLPGLLAERVEFRQQRTRKRAPCYKAGLGVAERALKLRVGEGRCGVLLEILRCRLHERFLN